MTGADAVKALPATIRIGPFEFQIKPQNTHTSHDRAEWGRCSTIEQVLYVQEDMPSRYKVVDTFLHECLHAIFWAYYIADEDKEERTVATVATGLTALHRDNPWLAGWITAALAS